MQLQKLQRYATRPGFFYTDDGGADVVVRSETAEQLWLSVLEPVDKPSAFYNQAVRLPDDAADRLLDYMRHYPICSRSMSSRLCRLTVVLSMCFPARCYSPATLSMTGSCRSRISDATSFAKLIFKRFNKTWTFGKGFVEVSGLSSAKLCALVDESEQFVSSNSN